MLSYRHAFHAGNHADVLKHVVLVQVLEYMQHKDKPFLYVDTHAGAGLYDLTGEWANKTREYNAGIGRIWQNRSAPQALNTYLEFIRALNSDGVLQCYPGSPWLAQGLLRAQDRARLFELHSNEYQLLKENFAGKKNVKPEQVDGFKALAAVLPPESRRGVILIDPPYEVKQDYTTALQALLEAHKKFAGGVYLLWYPVVERARVSRMEQTLVTSGIRNVLQIELCVRSDNEPGMTGSGMLVVNPPWMLRETMQALLPWLDAQLALNDTSQYRLVDLVEQ